MRAKSLAKSAHFVVRLQAPEFKCLETPWFVVPTPAFSVPNRPICVYDHLDGVIESTFPTPPPEQANNPEVAKTITANSHWESNLGPSPTVFSDKGIRKDGISLKNKALFLQLSICIILSQAVAAASQGSIPPPLSVPPSLAAARTIFVSNAGADSGLFPQPFSGDPARGYTQFHAALKSSGQFNLVSDPSEADLVLELELIAPNGPSSGNKQNGASDPVPMFRLRIYDRKTHYILWTITESIEVALKQKTHDRNFDQALQNILFNFQQLTGKLPTGPH